MTWCLGKAINISFQWHGSQKTTLLVRTCTIHYKYLRLNLIHHLWEGKPFLTNGVCRQLRVCGEGSEATFLREKIGKVISKPEYCDIYIVWWDVQQIMSIVKDFIERPSWHYGRDLAAKSSQLTTSRWCGSCRPWSVCRESLCGSWPFKRRIPTGVIAILLAWGKSRLRYWRCLLQDYLGLYKLETGTVIPVLAAWNIVPSKKQNQVELDIEREMHLYICLHR